MQARKDKLKGAHTVCGQMSILAQIFKNLQISFWPSFLWADNDINHVVFTEKSSHYISVLNEMKAVYYFLSHEIMPCFLVYMKVPCLD